MTEPEQPRSRREACDAERQRRDDAVAPAEESADATAPESGDWGDDDWGDPTEAIQVVESTQALPVADATRVLPSQDATARLAQPAVTVVAPVIGAGAAVNGAGGGAGGGGGDDGDASRNPFRRHPQAWLAAALAVVFLLLGTAAFAGGLAVGAAADTEVTAPDDSEPEPEVPVEDPARPVPDPIAAPTALRTCSITPQTQTAQLGDLYASVIDATTGEVLFDRQATTPVRTASVLKMLTAAVALEVLGPDHRITTRVVTGATPETVVLVGGGDPTLSRLPAGQESFHRGAPKLSDLAAQVRASLPDEVTEIDLVLDSTLWDPNDNWDPSWDRAEQRDGYMSEATALQVDGDRDDPTRGTSRRSDDPIARVGEWFSAALEAEGFTVGSVSQAAAPAGTAVLAEVQSQPVSTLVQQMLLVSDNTLSEMLARLSSKTLGMAGTFASLQGAYSAALSSLGIPTTGMVIRDGSGLSEFNAVTPVYVAQLAAKALHGERNLGVLHAGLPVAGQSGSLASRFTGDNAAARGRVAAKTGWIWTGRSLAGTIQAQDGSTLAFAYMAVGDDDVVTTTALDTLATAAFRCGLNLSNH